MYKYHNQLYYTNCKLIIINYKYFVFSHQVLNNNCGVRSVWLIINIECFFFNLTITSVFVYVCVHMCKRYVYNVHDNTRIGRRSSHKSRDIHDGTEKKQVH